MDMGLGKSNEIRTRIKAALILLALTQLVSEGGWVDQVTQMGRIGMFEIIRRMWPEWRMDVQGTLPNDLKDRGVGDVKALPHYHYRDDALLLYDAIKKYVTAVVNARYVSPTQIKDEHELQSWGKEITTPVPTGFGVQGVPGDGNFTTTAQIIEAGTSIIYISSVGHAAVNCGQYDKYALPPNYPFRLRGNILTSKDALSEDAILDHLPDKKITLDIMVMTSLLSTRATNPLGNFEINYQYDPVGKKVVEELKLSLKKIEAIINKRTSPYQYLNPNAVPNAISI
ncbi:arachidonate 12-lipoxygenase, 12R-type-like [Saccoglossus kowalevskii]